MKYFFCILIFLSSSYLLAGTSQNLPLIPKVIYGIDDRQDVFESNDNLMKEIAASTAALIRDDNLIESNGLFTAKARTLVQNGICSYERFSNQITAAGCSGFLVGPRTLVTAGHCVSSQNECKNQNWVFDYANTDEVKKTHVFRPDQIYKCEKIIERKKDTDTLADYAVLKLDRAVVGRRPLEVRKEGRARNDAVMTVIGYPTGLPAKITVGAEMRDNSNPIYFTLNSDTYNKNSGSVVVDSRTGIVEGILVRGDTDFIETSAGCNTSIVRPQDGGLGEGVTRITIIKSKF